MKVLILALLASWSALCADAPDWVRQAAEQLVPAFPPKISVVVLLQEEQLTVDDDGRRLMRERGVLKILQRSRDAVSAFRTYNTKSGRIRDFRGWLLRPSGPVITYTNDRIMDIALSRQYTYDEGRARLLECDADVPAGSVFAYEIVEEEKTVFTQYLYRPQQAAPVMLSRFVLTLPPGWEINDRVFNRDGAKPVISGNTFTWELRDLPAVEDEEYGPDLDDLTPRLAVSYYPSGGNRAGLQPLKDWPAVSSWLSSFVEPPAEVTPTVQRKAEELTRDAKTELDKIRVIAEFAQQTNYVSVQMNITRGGGYTPHRAEQVLTNNYGDCKDKATLMRALLKAVGIESHLTVIFSGDRRYVRPEWASPQQFNHAIIAIRVSPEIKLPTVIEHGGLGRLLIFDPTSAATPLGDLPESQQGSYALVIAGSQGQAVMMPLLAASANRIETSVEATLASDGSLNANLARSYRGQPAARIRTLVQRRDPEGFKRLFETSLHRRLGGVMLKKIEPADNAPDGKLRLEMDFSAKQFGQMLQERLLVLPVGSLVAQNLYTFTSKERKLPIVLSASASKDEVVLRVPAGFEVDEVPDAVRLESPYGVYEAKWEAKPGEVRFLQKLEVKETYAPASEYPQIREFFNAVGGSEQAPVVLLRK